MPTNQQDLYKGKLEKPELVSYSHGRIRGQLIQTLSMSEQHTVELYPEFDNPDMAAAIHDTEGAESAFEWLSSEQHQIESALMDTNPSSSPSMWDPGTVRPIDLLMRYRGLNSGNISAARLEMYGQVSSKTSSNDTKSASKNNLGLKFLKKRDIVNGEIQYTRFVKGTPAYPTEDDVAVDNNGVGTFPSTLTPVQLAGGLSTVSVLYAKLNSVPSALFTNNTTQFTPTPTLVSGDTWEVYSVVAPHA